MKNKVQSITRAFDILRAIQSEQDGASVGAVAEKTGLHISTVSRLISTLEHVGAVERAKGAVFIGPQIIALANRAPWTERLVSIAQPYLLEVAAATQEAIGLTRQEGDECVVFYQIPGEHNVQIRDWTGERFPLHATSSGKLWMGDWTAKAVADYFSTRPKSVASGTITRLDVMQKEIDIAHRTNIAWTQNELEDGLLSIAVPLQPLEEGQPVAIYLSAPSFRFNNKASRHLLAQQMMVAADKVNKAINSL